MNLGVLLRVHCRALTLDLALSEIFRYEKVVPSLKVHVHILADRPTDEVVAVLRRYQDRLAFWKSCPFPIVSPDGERWGEASNLQMLDFNTAWAPKPDWILFQDDDRWLEPLHAPAELETALWNPDVDMWYAHSLFMWDHPDRYHSGRHHHSPILFRFQPGDYFPRNRVIQATEGVHDQAIMASRIATLRTPLLDYGSFHSTERIRLYNAFVEAGKVDPYIDSLLAPSEAGLRSFPADAVKAGLAPDHDWVDLFTERILADGPN